MRGFRRGFRRGPGPFRPPRLRPRPMFRRPWRPMLIPHWGLSMLLVPLLGIVGLMMLLGFLGWMF